MSDYLYHLLPELREQIFRCCRITDLKNLSCCSSSYNRVLKEILWQKVTIPWEYLLKSEPISNEESRLPNLRFTRTLRFIVNVGWQYEAEYMTNYRYILNCCNSTLLHSLVIDRHIDAYATPERPYCFEEVDLCCIEETVQKLQCLRKLTIMYMKINEESLNAIGELNLNELNLRDHSICDYKFAIICQRLCKLKVLCIEGNYSINNIGLGHIANLKSLEELTLSKCSFTDDGLSRICSLTSLKVLDVNRCHNVTDNGIPGLTKLVSLCKLDLSHCFKITDAGVFHLSKISTLQHVNLNYCMRVTETGLLEIAKLNNLRSLKIASTGLTDRGLKAISKLRYLTKLNITRCRNVSDVGISHLQSLTCLRKLNVSGTKISEDAVLHLHPIQSLRALHISGCHFINDAGLSHIQGLSQLQLLDISYTKVTNVGLSSLTAMASLRTLKCHHAIFCAALELPFEDVTLICIDSTDEQECRAEVVF